MRHPRERGGMVGPGIGKPTGGGASARFSGKTLPFVVASRKVRSRRRLADECLSPSPHHPSRRRLAPPPLYRRRGRGDGRGGHHGRGRARRADRGELVPMSPKGNQHEVVKTALLHRWYRRTPEGFLPTPETTFRLSADTYLEPDVVVYPR